MATKAQGGVQPPGSRSLLERLRSREDSEHEQAIIRFVIVFFAATYFFIISHNTGFSVDDYHYSVAVVTGWWSENSAPSVSKPLSPTPEPWGASRL